MSGQACTNHDLENEASFLEWLVKSRLQEMSDEMLPLILELIHVVKSSSGPINSATYQKLLSGNPILSQASNEKYGLRLSLELYRLPSQTLGISESIWKSNTEDEALLGVSLTGIMDHPMLSGRGDKNELKKWLRHASKRPLRLMESGPLGWVLTRLQPLLLLSLQVLLVSWSISASGIHPRYSSQYIRRVRADWS